MNHALQEAKLQAKRYLKYLKKEQKSLHFPKRYKVAQKDIETDAVQLKHCQSFIAIKLGLHNWNQLHSLLSFEDTQTEQDFGTLFHKPACDVFLNHWFADYESARKQLGDGANYFLLPYKKQFVVARENYLDTLDIHSALSEQWQSINHDLVAGYATVAWDQIAKRAIEHKLLALFQ